MENKKVFEREKYSDLIITGFSSWIDKDFKSLVFRIINNIRTVHYNFNYKCHQEISLLSLIFDKSIIERAIDRVIYHIDITTKIDKEKEGYKFVSDKKTLRELILKGEDKFISVNPYNGKFSKYKSVDDLKFCLELEYQLQVISRYLKSKSSKKLFEILNILSK